MLHSATCLPGCRGIAPVRSRPAVRIPRPANCHRPAQSDLPSITVSRTAPPSTSFCGGSIAGGGAGAGRSDPGVTRLGGAGRATGGDRPRRETAEVDQRQDRCRSFRRRARAVVQAAPITKDQPSANHKLAISACKSELSSSIYSFNHVAKRRHGHEGTGKRKGRTGKLSPTSKRSSRRPSPPSRIAATAVRL